MLDTLDVSIDQALIDAATAYAQQQKMSLDELLAQHFKTLPRLDTAMAPIAPQSLTH